MRLALATPGRSSAMTPGNRLSALLNTAGGVGERTEMIIDSHGHYTTAPDALWEWRDRQIKAIGDPASAPKVSELSMSDDDIRASLEGQQLKLQAERGTD